MVIVVLVIMLASCSKTPDYKVWIRDNGSRTIPTIDESDTIYPEFTIFSEDYDREGAPKDLSIEYYDSVYNLTYSNSRDYLGDHPTLDFYEFEDEKIKVRFGIDAKSSQIIIFNAYKKDYIEEYKQRIKNNEQEVDADECVSIAEKYLSNKLGRFPEYQLEIATEHMHRNNQAIMVKFAYYVDGIKTNEEISVEMNDFGEITGYNLSMVGVMRGFVPPSAEDMVHIENNLHDRIASIYDNYAYAYDYKIVHREFMRLYDGQYLLNYRTVEIPYMTRETVLGVENRILDDSISWGFAYGYIVYL